MLELGLTILGVWLTWVAWSRMLRPSILDDTRDRLFDLREGVRRYFLAQGHGLDHAVYVELRNLINSHLRYTEELTFFHFVHANVWSVKHQQSAAALRARVDRRFKCSDPLLQAYVSEIRARAGAEMVEYAFRSSLAARTIGILGWALQLIKRTLGALSAVVRNAPSFPRPSNNLRIGPRFSFAAALTSSVFLMLAPLGLQDSARARAVVEECALG